MTSRNEKEGRYAGSFTPLKETRKHIRDKEGLFEWLSGVDKEIVYKKLDRKVSSEYALGCYFCRASTSSFKYYKRKA